jgi:hemerythrin
VTFTQRFDAGECIVKEISSFLTNWITHHINEDQDFCAGIAEEMNGPQNKEKGWFARTFGGGD